MEDQVKEMNENNLAMEEVPSSEDKPSPSQPMDVQHCIYLYQIKKIVSMEYMFTHTVIIVFRDWSFWCFYKGNVQ